jgi:hypothetical protein
MALALVAALLVTGALAGAAVAAATATTAAREVRSHAAPRSRAATAPEIAHHGFFATGVTDYPQGIEVTAPLDPPTVTPSEVASVIGSYESQPLAGALVGPLLHSSTPIVVLATVRDNVFPGETPSAPYQAWVVTYFGTQPELLGNPAGVGASLPVITDCLSFAVEDVRTSQWSHFSQSCG